MSKTLKSTESIIWPKKGRVGDSSDGRIECNGRCKLNNNEICDGKIDGGEIADNKIEKKDQKMFKSKKTVGFSDFLIPGARLMFIKLR